MTPGQLLPSSFPDVAADADADVDADADADADEGPGSGAELFPGADVDAFPVRDSDAFSGSDAYGGVGTFPGAGSGILTLAVSTSLGIGIPLDSRIASTSWCLAPMWNASLSWLWNRMSHWEQLLVWFTKLGQFAFNLQ